MAAFFASKVGPRRFTLLCHALAAVLLLGVFPALVWFAPQRLPPGMGPDAVHGDFTQYYVGAVVVQRGLWNDLYPIPKAEVFSAPPTFQPYYHTFLFQPDRMQGQLAYYPPISVQIASDCSPALIASFPEAQARFRYIYPPPTALFFWPLSWTSYDRAARLVWPALGYAGLGGLLFFAGRIHRLLRGGVSYSEGLIVLTGLFLIYRGHNGISEGNVTPILAGLVAFAVYALMRERLFLFSCALIPLVIVKTIGLMWLPLLLLERKYGRAILYLAILSVLINGLTLALGGTGVYLKFFSLLPLIGIPTGHGVVISILELFGFYPHAFYLLFDLAILVAAYGGYWLQRRAGAAPEYLPLLALLAGTMALFCLTNFSVWEAYTPDYLFLPFLGWIVREAQLATGKWRVFVVAGTVLSTVVLGGNWIIVGAIFHVVGGGSVGWYQGWIDRPICVAGVPLFLLIVALRRLLKRESPVVAAVYDRRPSHAPETSDRRS